jgi:hypothetical protein
LFTPRHRRLPGFAASEGAILETLSIHACQALRLFTSFAIA